MDNQYTARIRAIGHPASMDQSSATVSIELDDGLRQRIKKMLADGLKTKTEPAPEDNHQFAAILGQLHERGPDDLEGKLVIAGFVDYPYGEERRRCQHCMYYLLHGKFCALPELALPVEPHWYCRLWRI